MCRRHWYLFTAMGHFIQYTADCRRMFDISGTRRIVTSDHALCENAQTTGVCSAFTSLLNISHKPLGISEMIANILEPWNSFHEAQPRCDFLEVVLKPRLLSTAVQDNGTAPYAPTP